VPAAASLRTLASAVLALAAATAHAEPLDLNDPTPRDVLFQVETSGNLATVGQSFGPALPATYSASGGIGTLVIPISSHEALRAFLPPVPGSFTPIVIQIDLATHAATSQPAGGQMADGPITFAFTQNALGTGTTGGFVGPTLAPLFCISQQQVDNLCPIFPPICGQTCTLVPGSVYDPQSGELNLIGSETQSGCDGAVCQGPFDLFTQRGDLRLSEATEIPLLPAPAGALLFLCLLATAVPPRRKPD
jgi:hypothetical protein